ncbi:MAG: 3-dehydroquinate synthase [Leeuwenhoekiella sp.]
MEAIEAQDYQIVFNSSGYEELNNYLSITNHSIIFLLVDSNTHEHCLPAFLANIETNTTIEIIEIDPGEEIKNLETCTGVWNVLSELNADRKSLLINLGGGVVTDLGGFVACTFRRGIDFINVPTTLLSMVDASVGGKTGVDLGNLKNQIGIISNPQMVLVDTIFLNSLPVAELRSGYAEMLKHGLISNLEYWDDVKNHGYKDIENLGKLIHESVQIKNNIVTQDPFEKNIRKTLNYGHTLGHAIESYFLSNENKKRLLHGEAIAIGMILASYLSYKTVGLSQIECENISQSINHYYDRENFTDDDIKNIITLLKFDKKNSHGRINFVLLEKIGIPVIDKEVGNDLIHEAFKYYKNLKV